jgi:hypothetical protein
MLVSVYYSNVSPFFTLLPFPKKLRFPSPTAWAAYINKFIVWRELGLDMLDWLSTVVIVAVCLRSGNNNKVLV